MRTLTAPEEAAGLGANACHSVMDHDQWCGAEQMKTALAKVGIQVGEPGALSACSPLVLSELGSCTCLRSLMMVLSGTQIRDQANAWGHD